MKIRILLTAMFMLFCLNTMKAQSHKVGQANYNCKLNKKGWFFNNEKHSCPACKAIEDKEKAAKASEDKRRNDVAVAKAKADKAASDLAYKKKQAEIEENNKVTEVKVVMPKGSGAGADKTEDNKTRNYTVQNELKLGQGMSYLKAYNSKILNNGKVVFESDDFMNISKFEGKALFTANYPWLEDDCKSTYSTNLSILLDENFQKVNLEGVNQFYYSKTNRDNDSYIDITVLTGNCTPIEGDRYSNAEWHTKEYTFEYKTWKLIKSDTSAYRTECTCN